MNDRLLVEMSNAYYNGISPNEFKNCFKDDILTCIEIRNALEQKQVQTQAARDMARNL